MIHSNHVCGSMRMIPFITLAIVLCTELASAQPDAKDFDLAPPVGRTTEEAAKDFLSADKKLTCNAAITYGKDGERLMPVVKTKRSLRKAKLALVSGVEVKSTVADEPVERKPQNDLPAVMREGMPLNYDVAAVVAADGSVGFVARGTSRFDPTVKSRTVRLQLKRKAVFRAYVDALVRLSEALDGVDIEALATYDSTLAQFITGRTEDAATLTRKDHETWSRVVRAATRAAVLFEMKVNDEQGIALVWVTVDSRSLEGQAASLAYRTAQDIQSGLQSFLRDAWAGSIPMACGQTVVTPEGDVLYVGYAAVVKPKGGDFDLLQAKLEAADKWRRNMADTALMSAIPGIGAEVSAQTSGDEEIVKTAQQFEELVAPDGSKQREVLGQTVRGFHIHQETKDRTSWRVKGRLPEGVQRQVYESRDGEWLMAISIYHPALSAEAKALAAKMADAFREGR